MAAFQTKFLRRRSTQAVPVTSTIGEVNPTDQPITPGRDPAGLKDSGPDQDQQQLAIENTDPARRRIVQPRRGWVYRLMKMAAIAVNPRPPSQEELAEMNEAKARELLARAIQADAETAIAWMTACLDRIGICYVRKASDGQIKKIHHVMFDEVRMEPDAIHVHVDTHKLPWGVSALQLRDQETIDNLSNAVGRAITCTWTPEAGVWYTIERASGRAGIPNHVQISELWERMPASSDSLTIAVGRSHNARLIYEDLSRMPHALVAGATLSGKTTFLHGIICTLIRRNQPDRMRMVLVDLKGGLAFKKYIGIPHLLTSEEFCPNGVITERENVLAMLKWLVVDGERRMRVLSAANCESIGQYNQNRKKGRMPYLVVVIDEWADMMYSPDKTTAETNLVNVVQRMRAVGFHMIVATQIPKSEVITGLIKGNLPCRFAFGVPNLHASMAILDNRSAVGLQPPGRMVMQFLSERQVQAPWISQDLIEATIKGAATGVYGEIKKSHDVTQQEVREWAVYNNDGWLIYQKIYSQFRERGITVAEIRGWIDLWEKETFLIGNSVYKIDPAAGRRGARLVVDHSGEPATVQPAALEIDPAPEQEKEPAEACPMCGVLYEDDERICTQCGAPRPEEG